MADLSHTASAPRANSGGRRLCGPISSSNADRSFGRRVLPVGRRPVDACPSLGDPPRRVLLHGYWATVAGRRMGFRGTSGLDGEPHRCHFLLAGLCRGLRRRAAGRRGAMEDDGCWLAMDSRPIGAGRRRLVCRPGPAPTGPQLFLLCSGHASAYPRPSASRLALRRPCAATCLGQRTRELSARPRAFLPSRSCGVFCLQLWGGCQFPDRYLES